MLPRHWLVGWLAGLGDVDLNYFLIEVPKDKDSDDDVRFLHDSLSVIVKHKSQHLLFYFLSAIDEGVQTNKDLDKIVPNFTDRFFALDAKVTLSEDCCFLIRRYIYATYNFNVDG